MQGTAERRCEIMKILCRRRSESIKRLAIELGVSERTVRRDIDVLSMQEPIYTQTGRKGGVYVDEKYFMNRMYMTEDELNVLHKLAYIADRHDLDDGERKILHSIISSYTKPK